MPPQSIREVYAKAKLGTAKKKTSAASTSTVPPGKFTAFYTYAQDEICEQKSPDDSWVCTREKGHDGPHQPLCVDGTWAWSKPYLNGKWVELPIVDDKHGYETLVDDVPEFKPGIQTCLAMYPMNTSTQSFCCNRPKGHEGSHQSIIKDTGKSNTPPWHDGPYCSGFSGTFICTEPAGHTGPHIATGSGWKVLEIWENKSDSIG